METVYIPTRGRHANIRKLLPRWKAADFNVVLVVEPEELESHAALAAEFGDWVRAVTPPSNSGGIGRARQYAVEHAAQMGLTSIVMADDDIGPATDSGAKKLAEVAAVPGVLAVGARVPYHNFAFGDRLDEFSQGPILCPTGLAFRLFGLNINAAMEVGNFDHTLICQNEDGEMMRQGIANGYPWLLHTGVHAVSIGARFQPGGVRGYLGIKDDVKTAEAGNLVKENDEVKRCHTIVHERWPKYVSHPSKPLRTQWRKMYNDFIPHWQKWSALHGGKLPHDEL